MSAVVHLSRRYRFSASHRLHLDSLSPERNREMFGKCNNPFGHGHNYFVQVTLSGPVPSETGMVVNLADLDGFAERELLERFDETNLNMLESFRDTVPTTENLCTELWRVFAAFARQRPGVTLARVRVEETGNNAFDYFGGDGPGLPEAFEIEERPIAR